MAFGSAMRAMTDATAEATAEASAAPPVDATGVDDPSRAIDASFVRSSGARDLAEVEDGDAAATLPLPELLCIGWDEIQSSTAPGPGYLLSQTSSD